MLEAIAALAIVGATGAGVLAATGAGVRGAERARRALEAAALAQEVESQLALADAATLTLLPDSLVAGQFDEPFDDYTWRTEVRPHPELAGAFVVRVAVRWRDGEQSLTTALYRRPMTAQDSVP